MKTYKIIISQIIEKKPKELFTLVINSENSKEELLRGYQIKYNGLHVFVEDVKAVEVVDCKLNPIQEQDDEHSSVTLRKDQYSGKTYNRATISAGDISEWQEWIKPIQEAQQKLNDAEDTFKNNVMNKFKLKKVESFHRKYNQVVFEFHNPAFDFLQSNKKK